MKSPSVNLHASEGGLEKDVKACAHDLSALDEYVQALRIPKQDSAVPEGNLTTEGEERAQKEDDLISIASIVVLAIFCLYKLFGEDYQQDFYCKSSQGRFYWAFLVNVVKEALMKYTAKALQPSATGEPEGAGIRALKRLCRVSRVPLFILVFSAITVAPGAFCKCQE
ncbi:hypothetical protein W97_03678 [Coniosporium apollinis CBS 100218]|uniref:Uncharacterized protein n=1 Tax=Coniosporium apollinis (strain CBS 100218) TaxID=1168221 RepID=R7YRA4_CONA1|nr:uncharacterized protein W97_03678 [Coniosporium apollinis CBS 100218]EON64447.1 hypothetical protein W97_03678 [Coniosporium apollinis CBS 100218]